jgi:hypothetical protein
MKLLNKYPLLILVIIVFCSFKTMAQDGKPSLIIDLAYNQQNNRIPFVSVYTKAKIEKKFTAIPNIEVSVYLDEQTPSNLVGTVKTNAEGKGRLGFPVNLKNTWDTLQNFTLIATAPATRQFDSTGTESTFTKAKIFIHTSIEDSIKTIEVMVKEKKGMEWVPVPGVETKVIIKRSVGDLSVGDDETYTTDSTGVAIAEFKKTAMPGDAHGNIVIVAKTEDNDQFGNISIEQNLKWGVPLVIQNNFNQRTLFATRDKAPVWLMMLATSVIIIVWSVIFYLFWLILKIKKAGIVKNGIVI